MDRPRLPLMLLPAMGCDGRLWARQIMDLADMAEPEFGEVGQAQGTRAQPRPVAAALRAALGDVPQRVGPGIAVAVRVRGPADAHGIEDDDEGARHGQADSSSAAASLSRAKAALNRARV